jgi:hypothetical protein
VRAFISGVEAAGKGYIGRDGHHRFRGRHNEFGIGAAARTVGANDRNHRVPRPKRGVGARSNRVDDARRVHARHRIRQLDHPQHLGSTELGQADCPHDHRLLRTFIIELKLTGSRAFPRVAGFTP